MEDHILIDFMQKQTSALAAVSTQLDDLHSRLFGNGQPGAIQYLHGEIEGLKGKDADLETNLAALDKSSAILSWKLGTLSAVAGASLTFIAQWFTKHVFHIQ